MTYLQLLTLLTERLHAIKNCGISIANPFDKKRWILDFVPETTEDEKRALQKVIDKFEYSFVQKEQ